MRYCSILLEKDNFPILFHIYNNPAIGLGLVERLGQLPDLVTLPVLLS